MELILGECGREHDFPDDKLEVTGTKIGRHGRVVSVSELACRRCGTRQVRELPDPGPGEPGTSRVLLVVGTYALPEPGDVPGISERAARLTEEEFARVAERRGFTGGPPEGLAPDRRATAVREHLVFVLSIEAGRFYLLDEGRSIGEILPVPVHAESAGPMRAVPGAVAFWAPVDEGELLLRLTIDVRDPGPVGADHAEVSCRFRSGHVVLRELGGTEHALPPLPAGHGDYRLRFTPGRGLLQIWNSPRTRAVDYSQTTPSPSRS